VICTAAASVPGSPESKRRKIAKALEGRISTKNPRNAYKTAWRSFFAFCSEYKLELDPVCQSQASAPRTRKRHAAVFEENEIKAFLNAIKVDSLIDKRHKALFGVLLYTWARVSAVVALKVESYYERKGERWLRLGEKRGKIHEVPVHSKARKTLSSGFSLRSWI
jgi:integrase